jgi:cyanophycin synthetase
MEAEPVAGPVRATEIRVLEGPNLYFSRPAIKLTLDAPGWMRASEERLTAIASTLGAWANIPVGKPQSEQRRRAVARIASRVARMIALASGSHSLAVRGRLGPAPNQVVVAFPWRRQYVAEALAAETAWVMGAILRRAPKRVINEAVARLADVEPGPEPSVPDPIVPVIQVTGTNGKTTTVRLLAHMVRSAGRSVAYSSTDGVFSGDGELLQGGDYSGFGGAAMAMASGPDIAVLETARGGLLMRGCGVQHNDVAVVTNVSADHLGLHGIDTVDQLAEVKSVITRITRPDGWVVLNADDPRVLAMRRTATGRPWLFSLDPDHPAFREVLARDGRAMSIQDGRMTWFDRYEAHTLVPILDVPVTLAGVSRINAQNAMAAAAAALAIGLPSRAVVKGLKTFVQDPERNPGRANMFDLGGRIVMIDYAHNEAGMIGMSEALQGLRRAGNRIWLAVCTAGDRTDVILHAFGFRAAVGSDHLAIAELGQYLRGRTREDIVERLREGAAEAGVSDVPCYPDELTALQGMLAQAQTGDVVGVTALGMRPEIFAWLETKGATRMGPADVRRVVRRAQRQAPAAHP